MYETRRTTINGHVGWWGLVRRVMWVWVIWYGLGVGWVRRREGVSDEMGGVTDGKVLAFGGVEV